MGPFLEIIISLLISSTLIIKYKYDNYAAMLFVTSLDAQVLPLVVITEKCTLWQKQKIVGAYHIKLILAISRTFEWL